MDRLPVISREMVRVPITAFSDGDSTDPTALPVDAALVATDTQPDSGDWVEVAWSAGTSTPHVEFLVGPGGDFVRAVGRWSIWLRVRGAIEEPQRAVGQVTIV